YFETILHTFIAIFYARFVARADLVHIHAIGPGLFAPLARLLGMKVVVTHHGADYQRQKWSAFAKWLLRQGEAMAIAASHATIVVGATLCEALKQQYPAHQDKLLYIPNGADVGPRAAADQLRHHPVLAQFGLKPGQYVLSVGRLVPEKEDRKSTRLNSSHVKISYAVFCLKKKKVNRTRAGGPKRASQ